MVLNFLTKLFGSNNDRILKKIQPIIDQINEFEPQIQALSDIQIGEKTTEFKNRLAKGETLDDILPEAFALVREASVRTLGLRHYDVQLIGGIALHRGTIAEMKTGEGKTLMSTLPAYLNALSGKGVHIVTVNDYLAKRDAEWMSQVYDFLGLSVGVVLHDLDSQERKQAYAADITYGTNNEFGFDYLRDNMKFDPEELAQGNLNFAIVDEVDSILIDEARTPLIISGPAEKSTHLYTQINTIIPAFEKDTDYTLDEESKTVSLTEDGIAKGEELLNVDNLYDPANIELLHHLNQALKAHVIFKRDTDYIVKNDQVIIVDEFTGRLMSGRRYSEGLHQALEAKEGVKIENENQTLASITFQNYFRMYDKLSGMTGTAETEAEEFKKIYNLDVLVIPTDKPMVREDRADLIYKTQKEKYDAAIQEIIRLHKKGQPVLVGTISIDVSEALSEKLKKKGIKHAVLNAKHHKEEAEIVANAGQKGAVTISTNMAGRGTDIKLGEGVKALGGLHILGTSRHESRRIDNQLRGRSGRQGDPGSSRFYLSLEDDLLRIFGGDRIHSVMDRLGIEEGEHIEHKFISKAIENAQSKVEGHNFEIRKHLLEYDDVMNQQREIIYRQRRQALTAKDLRQVTHDMMEDVSYDLLEGFVLDKTAITEWDLEGLSAAIKSQFNMDLSLDEPVQKAFSADQLGQFIFDAAQARYQSREEMYGPEIIRHVERFIILQTVDTRWKEHLLNMDHLKEGIGLRGYAQQDPLRIYKKEGFDMFQDLMNRIKQEVVDILFKIQIASPNQVEEMKQEEQQDLTFSSHSDESAPKQPVRRSSEKVQRNAPCPCGSGKKYKKCCGQ
ncbi:preprotein translocase subunit SecA [Desulfobacter hydrogenophilus]|uniref:Protein translocase subunit SecA n=1 Tax=Desulfobacter hydrogenophilus TaxID=2291 RepID=A0A328FIZ8_9BACT|nr:preprotein translocase subunit SecA [Desulfobacter hydrogenophilus]NDY70825.1 preprotein translocase subunit SecA [Desulfobacter hydrogenophilus]QBH11596.1 preprotein translocase subunit SecA [Desulfobacter hydrogenophilus]RAM03143.1 preprotein translocase subunit SecA [Desulfobacter hydrogenophilus]